MKDLLAQASEIAELRDLDVFVPFLNELTQWRPEHEYDCEHCQQQLGALLQRLLAKHQLTGPWVRTTLLKWLAWAQDETGEDYGVDVQTTG